MKIPDVIKIGAREVLVVKVDRLSDDEDRWGDYNSRAGTIRIDAGIPADKMEETFFHEVLEAISDIYGQRLTESQILVLSAVLLGVFKDNPLGL